MKRHPLADEFRRLAASLREGGASQIADVWDRAAERVEAWHVKHELEALSLTAAAEASGYSASWLGKMISDGRLENVGRPFAPMVRRGDLPRKLKPVARRTDGAPDLVGPVLAKQGIVLDSES